jgi:RNA polymerase sigma factor (sigma-70 family)
MANGQMSGVLRHLRRVAFIRDGGGLTDGQLLERFLTRREEAAFEELVRRHGPMVLGVCRRILRHSQDAEDASQATFLVLVRKAASVRPRELVGNWLYGVAYRTSLKVRATIARRRVKEREMSRPEALEDKVWRELQPLVDQALNRLPDKYRVPIVLCDLEGKTHKEASRQLGCPVGTLSGRLSRARVLLAKGLSRRGLALSSGTVAAVLSQNTASACIPASLVISTVKAATLMAAGEAVSGVISTKVAALTEGMVKSVFVTKLKIATAVLMMMGVLGGGVFAPLALSKTPPGPEGTVVKSAAALAPAPEPEKRPRELLGKAARAADDIEDDARKAYALMNIGAAQAKTGDRDAASKTFARATEVAQVITHPNASQGEREKWTTLMFIATAQAEAGQTEAALRVAEVIEQPSTKEWALAMIAGAQVMAKDVKGALKTVEGISDSGKSLALGQVAGSLVLTGDFKQGLKLAGEIQDKCERVEVLTAIAEFQFRAGNRDEAKKIMGSAMETADGIKEDDPEARAKYAQYKIAGALITLGEEENGLKRAHDFIKKSSDRDEVLAYVACRRAEAGKVKEALEALVVLQEGENKGAVLMAVASAQARTGDFKQSRKTLDAIKSDGVNPNIIKVDGLLAVAAVRSQSGERDAATDLYLEAIRELKTLDTLWPDAGSMCGTPERLHRIVRAWAEAGDDKSALAWVDKQDSPFVKAVALAGIAEGIGKRLEPVKRSTDKK